MRKIRLVVRFLFASLANAALVKVAETVKTYISIVPYFWHVFTVSQSGFSSPSFLGASVQDEAVASSLSVSAFFETGAESSGVSLFSSLSAVFRVCVLYFGFLVAVVLYEVSD